MVVLTARDPELVETVPEASEIVVVVARERLFDPVAAHPLQLARDLQGESVTPGVVPSVAGLAPRLVAVDHDLDPVPHRVPDGRHGREVVARVGAVEAELDRLEAVLQEAPDVVDPLLRRADLRRRAVDPDARRVASPELVDGQSGSFADDVPERDLHAVDG